MKLARLFSVICLSAAGVHAECEATQSTALLEVETCWARHYSVVYGVPLEFVQAIIDVESAWQPNVISPKGAAGLMQLMPPTAATFGVTNRFRIEENIRGGVAYLAYLIRLFEGELRLVAAAYYAGEKEGARPRIWSRVVFRGWQGQLPLDLVENDRSVAGQIAPEFFTRAGEPRQLPAQFVDGIHAVTAAVSCRQCSHSHFLIEPRRRRGEQQESERGDQIEGSTDKDRETTAAAIG